MSSLPFSEGAQDRTRVSAPDEGQGAAMQGLGHCSITDIMWTVTQDSTYLPLLETDIPG